MDTHAEPPYPLQSRSIYQLSTAFTASRSPACSPSNHLFPTFDTATVSSSFLSPSPTSKVAGMLTHPASAAFSFSTSNPLLPTCPPSPAHSLFDGASASSSSSAASYSRPSSPIPADPYIASILSSPSDYPFPSLLSDELSEPLSGVGDIGCVVFGSPSSPSCVSPWSNEFEVSGGECDSGSASGGSDSEGRAEGVASDASTTMGGEQDSQPNSEDDDSYTAVSPSSPLPATEPNKRRRKPSVKQQQQQQITSKPITEKGRKRRLTVSAAPQQCDDESVVPEDKRERNKQSASDYRKRRKLYVVSLEQQLNEVKAALRVEREEGKKLRGENTVLRASMQMMREFVQGNKPSTATQKEQRVEQKEADEDEHEEQAAEAVKRWETAVSVRIPEEYRPVAPSQQVEVDTEEGAAHTHNTRKRRGGRVATTKAGSKQHKVGLTLFVLFSCFLLYFPWLTELSSSPLLHTPSATTMVDVLGGDKVGEPSSLFYSTPPDCVLQPELCNRGRTILEVMDSDVQAFFDEQYAAWDVLLDEEAAVGVKAEPYLVEEPVVEQLVDGVMSPLTLPIAAHNASAALAWLSEHAEDGIEQLVKQAAVDHNYEDIGWATTSASDSGSLQQAV